MNVYSFNISFNGGNTNMNLQREPVHSQVVEQATRDLLKERGVEIVDIAEIVYDLQKPYHPRLKMEDCIESVNKVLTKREIQHALLVGIELDKLAENKQLSEPLQTIVEMDEGLFGVDETLAIGSVFGYGSIALTTFGYLDKEKVGVIKKLDETKDHSVHTFLDDLISSVASNAASRLAHKLRDKEEFIEQKKLDEREEEQNIG